eukprot:1160330-Pelagomonas_calceolata.AAC.2
MSASEYMDQGHLHQTIAGQRSSEVPLMKDCRTAESDASTMLGKTRLPHPDCLPHLCGVQNFT